MGEAGQATVELVALLPLLALVGFSLFSAAASAATAETAGQAAHAGAVALLQDGDPREAARDAIPLGLRDRARIVVDGPRVSVRIVPDLPVDAVEPLLAATASADAGEEARP